ncbi:MAG: dihydrolipoamide acetyltransferase family protein [Rectinemataceae bacterium]
MALEVMMPQLGLTMKEGLITEWKKKKGDAVARGEVIFAVENDKATVDVEAQGDGVLASILVEEMVTVPVGTIVALIAAPGEKVTATQNASAVPPARPTTKASQPASPATPEAKPAAMAANVDGFVLASPFARQTAESLGISLSEVRGTGPEGAVLGRDLPKTDLMQSVAVKAAFEPLRSPVSSVPPAPPAPPASPEANTEISLSRIQRVAAERMTQSWTTIPQFTLYDDADAAPMLSLAERFKKAGDSVSLTVILAKLLAAAAGRHPLLNAAWLGEGKVRSYAVVNVNIAIDTSEGLVVPVLRACASRGFRELGADLKAIAEKARNKALSPEDYEGGTITLSNLGMFGIARFRAIINPPQTAILAVGRISEKVVQRASGFETRKFIEYSITADHRVVDGACAARFMATLKSYIENPLLLLD